MMNQHRTPPLPPQPQQQPPLQQQPTPQQQQQQQAPAQAPVPPPQQQNGPDQMSTTQTMAATMHGGPNNTTPAYYTSGTTMCATSHPGTPGGGNGMTVVSPVIGASPRACAGCGTKIVERFLLLALDRYWHTGCLKCSCCHATLADIGSSCYTRSGMILCRQDYIRLFGNSGACSACGQSIPAHEFVMRAQTNVYHLNCFACVKCSSKLVSGDRFNLVNGNLLCEQDCLKLMKGSVTASSRKNKSRINSTIKV